MRFPFAVKLSQAEIREMSRRALLEDEAFQDVTTLALKKRKKYVRSVLMAEEEGVLCGMPFAKGVFRASSTALRFKDFFEDGMEVKPGDVVAEVEGIAEAILRAERVALNFLMILSGIATKVRFFRTEIGEETIVLDTRKTYPLSRKAQKYAVLVGGGRNHRLSLSQMVLVKDNHKLLYGNDLTALLTDLFAAKREDILVEVEVDNVQEARAALEFPVNGLLMDNMRVEGMRRVVKLAREKGVWIEISGKVRQHYLSTLRSLQADFVSASATVLKSASIDFTLDFVEVT